MSLSAYSWRSRGRAPMVNHAAVWPDSADLGRLQQPVSGHALVAGGRGQSSRGRCGKKRARSSRRLPVDHHWLAHLCHKALLLHFPHPRALSLVRPHFTSQLIEDTPPSSPFSCRPQASTRLLLRLVADHLLNHPSSRHVMTSNTHRSPSSRLPLCPTLQNGLTPLEHAPFPRAAVATLLRADPRVIAAADTAAAGSPS